MSVSWDIHLFDFSAQMPPLFCEQLYRLSKKILKQKNLEDHRSAKQLLLYPQYCFCVHLMLVWGLGDSGRKSTVNTAKQNAVSLSHQPENISGASLKPKFIVIAQYQLSGMYIYKERRKCNY